MNNVMASCSESFKVAAEQKMKSIYNIHIVLTLFGILQTTAYYIPFENG